MERPKQLQFDPDLCIYSYPSEDPRPDCSVFESVVRRIGETIRSSFRPENEMDRFRELVSKCRRHKLSVVFGNLGRHPDVLTCFLDLNFAHDEEVVVQSEYPTGSHYQDREDDGRGILFVVEPYFGKTLRPESFGATNVIVLTSHLKVDVPEGVPTFFYHAGREQSYNPLVEGGEDAVPFVPPVFFDGRWHPPCGPACLDLKSSRSACEAYLRLLTGKEMIRNLPYVVSVAPETIRHWKTLLPKKQMKKLMRDKRHRQLYLGDLE